MSDLVLGGEEVVILSLPVATDVGHDRLLTEAERQVAMLAALGRSNGEIAAERGVSLRTVANQLASAYRKLGVRGRGELAAHLTPDG